MFSPSKIAMRSTHCIPPTGHLHQAEVLTQVICSNSIQSSQDAKRRRGGVSKQTNQPTQKQGERKSSLKLHLDCGIQEYFPPSDPSVHPCWVLTPCLNEVWAHHRRKSQETESVLGRWGKDQTEIIGLDASFYLLLLLGRMPCYMIKKVPLALKFENFFLHHFSHISPAASLIK